MNEVNKILNNYLTGLIHKKAIKRQFIGNPAEYKSEGYLDPLGEKKFIKAKGLIHRYPDRVVLTVTNKCFAYCRFCFRKNNWQKFDGFDLKESLNYLKQTKTVREVLISGGDPFTLSDKELLNIIDALNNIDHIETIRIGTRVLSAYPQRITDNITKQLSQYKSIWLAIHINHPDEITQEFVIASGKIIDEGIPIVSQTVLLKNINDDVYTLKTLFCTLTKYRIKPYYLFGCDQASGNGVFRVSIEKAMKIISSLRGTISGLCMPSYAFDLPEGGGKVVLEPNSIISKNKNHYIFKNFEGKRREYIDV